MNVVVTDLFSSEINTHFYTDIQCSHALLTDFLNINTLDWLCRGTQNRNCGSLETILSSKVCVPSVNCACVTKLSNSNLERWSKTSTEKAHVPRTDNVILKVMILCSSPQSPSPHSATFISVHSHSVWDQEYWKAGGKSQIATKIPISLTKLVKSHDISWPVL